MSSYLKKERFKSFSYLERERETQLSVGVVYLQSDVTTSISLATCVGRRVSEKEKNSFNVAYHFSFRSMVQVCAASKHPSITNVGAGKIKKWARARRGKRPVLKAKLKANFELLLQVSK
jgi:hypothetical protein